MKTESFVDQIYLGTILLETNRWPDTPRTTFSRAEKLSRGRGAIPTVKPSEWAERARADGFDGLEIWENQILLADDAEFERQCRLARGSLIYSSYFKLDDQDALWREIAADAINKIGAGGVKYNFGTAMAEKELYLRHLNEWVSLLGRDVRIICECHKGNLCGDDPKIAAQIFAELPDQRYQATIHLGYSVNELEQWFKHLGPRIRHIHAGRHAAQGREFLTERMKLLRDHGFCGSYTIEFTDGIEWGKPQPDIETLYTNAVADLRLLREELAK